MYIDNSPSSVKWTLAEVITFAASIALMLYSHFHKSDYVACFTLGGIGLLAHVIMIIINPSYVYFNDEGKNIVLRTCSAYPVMRSYREIPFPKSSIVSYDIKESFFGLKKLLNITVKGKDRNTMKEVEYVIENVNISVLRKDTIQDLKIALDKALKA